MSKLDLVIDSCLNNVDLVGSCIGVLAAYLFDEAHSYQIQTCVVEAVTNCIKHSYLGKQGHKVSISYEMDEFKLVIDISDTGVAMDPQAFLNISTRFDYDLLDVENLPVGGWGIKIIKIWMDESRYYSENGINHLVMTKYVTSNNITNAPSCI